MATFLAHAREMTGRPLDCYQDLHRWSVEHYEEFWRILLDFSGITYVGRTTTVAEPKSMPGAKFFPDVRLSFAENLLRFDDDTPALVSLCESRAPVRLSYGELNQAVLRARTRLREYGIQRGDRVAGFMPNVAEAVIAMLAVTSIGAVWSSCSPDFGVQGILDRFGQIKPRLLFAANGYAYNGKRLDCLERIQRIVDAIPEIERVILIPFLADHPVHTDAFADKLVPWDAFCDTDGSDGHFERFPFNHPLYVMYSSGTTGTPKCIVHGAGGTLLQHSKELLLHSDLRRRDNIFYFTTCGWMMWNWLVSSLLTGATVTLFDGSPSYPSLDRLWTLVAEEGVTHFGTSPKFIGACRGSLVPKEKHDLSRLRVLLSTGAPLLPEDFDWIYDAVKPDLQVSSISGGTDIISCFMLGNPLLPVHRGEIQSIGLGMDVVALGQDGQPVVGEKGELVCRTPFPSMPVRFWNDPSGEKYRKAYFDRVPDVWFHGDYVELTGSQGSVGGVIVYGRSDATLNPGGVRIGTAEIYRLVETLPQVQDSIVVGQPWQGDVRMVLFVKLCADVRWSAEVEKTIREAIRAGATPRHVPAVILPVAAIPYTINGKKVELAVREIVTGEEPQNKEALADPTALDCYRHLCALA